MEKDDIRYLTTKRLVLRPPKMADIGAVFHIFASDPAVTRYLAWPQHRTLADTENFVHFSDHQWSSWPAGPYLICDKSEVSIMGSTGLTFFSADRASTGYVLAERYWGKGYANEALVRMIVLSRELGVNRLTADTHVSHRASQKVLLRNGFALEETMADAMVFPNSDTDKPQSVQRYVFSAEADYGP